DRLFTAGAYAYGLEAYGDDIALAIGELSTAGQGAVGVFAQGDSIRLNLDDVSTQGQSAEAINALAATDLEITSSGLITTGGDGSRAVFATSDGAVTLDLTDVSTSGAGAEAVAVSGLDADVLIRGDVSVTG